MTTGYLGQPVTLTTNSYAGTTYALTYEIVDPSDTTRATGPADATDDPTVFSATYEIPLDAITGEWLIQWGGTVDGVLVVASEDVEVHGSDAPTIPTTQGDRLPVLTDILGLDLTDVTVRFAMRPLGSTTVTVDAPAVVDDAGTGAVRYEWAEGDTDTAGSALGEWRLAYPDGRTLTVPYGSTISIMTRARLVDLPTLAETDRALIRAHIGNTTPPTDFDLAVLMGQLGTAAKVAAAVLQGRLAGPSKVSIDGDVSWELSKESQAAAATIIDQLVPVANGRLYRTDRER